MIVTDTNGKYGGGKYSKGRVGSTERRGISELGNKTNKA